MIVDTHLTIYDFLQQEKIKSLEGQVENLLEKEKQLLEELQQDQLNHKVSVSQFELKLEDNDSLLAQSKNQSVNSHNLSVCFFSSY